MTLQRCSPLTTVIALWVALVSPGCSRRSVDIASVPPAAPVVVSYRISGTPTIRLDLAYREAECLYAAHDYAGAEKIVDRLLAVAQISPTNHEFLLRQKAILHGGGKSQLPVDSQHSTISHQPVGDCGPRALAIACRQLGVKADVARLTHFAGTTDRGTSLEGLANAAGAVGLKAQGVQVNRLAFSDIKTPAVIWLNGGHFAVLLSVTDKIARIHDPNNPREEAVSTDELFKRSGGILLKLSRK